MGPHCTQNFQSCPTSCGQWIHCILGIFPIVNLQELTHSSAFISSREHGWKMFPEANNHAGLVFFFIFMRMNACMNMCTAHSLYNIFKFVQIRRRRRKKTFFKNKLKCSVLYIWVTIKKKCFKFQYAKEVCIK